MEKVARPFPEHFQRLRLPIALQVWSFPNRYYNKLHNSLLLDSSTEITSVQPLPPSPLPVALCNVQHEQLAAQLDGSDWQWERGRMAEGWGRKTLGQFLLNLSRTYNKLMPPYPFPPSFSRSLSGATFLQQVGWHSSGSKLKWNIWY